MGRRPTAKAPPMVGQALFAPVFARVPQRVPARSLPQTVPNTAEGKSHANLCSKRAQQTRPGRRNDSRVCSSRRAVGAACALLVSCSRQNQEKADQANAKANAEAKKLTADVKQEAHKVSDEVARGMNGPVSPPAAEAKRKLEDVGQEADHATLVARVKTKLAADVGLSAASSVWVDANGSLITLSGTTATTEAKQAAEQAASAVGPVRVVDNIVVQP
jgi:osmotically-inducible protein OsmY